MKKSIICIVCCSLFMAVAVAQDNVTYDIISATGTIVDKNSGKALQIGDQISFQTELEFGSLHDRAVLLDPAKAKFFLELPKSAFVNSQMTIASNLALTPVRVRSAPITSIRGASGLFAEGVSPKSLKEYFALETYTVIGERFTLPVSLRDAERFDLLLRYEIDNSVEEYVATDFTIDKNKLKTQGAGISECFVMLKEGGQATPITQVMLIFVEKEQLLREFDSLLNAMNQQRNEKDAAREILRQYSVDVYGIIDRNKLEETINDFLTLR